jgi:hypothetical protein
MPRANKARLAILAKARTARTRASTTPTTPRTPLLVPPSPSASAPSMRLTPARVRLERGAARRNPYVGCVRSALAGRSSGECFNAVRGKRC